MYKNVASQKVAVFAWDNINSEPKTGDAGNITAQISLDGGVSAATDDTNPTELDAADHPGVYLFDLLQAETNADLVVITPASSTAGVVFRPVIAYPTTLTSTKTGYIDQAISTTESNIRGADSDTLETLSDQLDAVETDTGEIGAAGAGLSDIPWNSDWDAEVQSECADALTAYDPPTKAEMDTALGNLNDITVAEIIAGISEGTLDLQEMLRIMLAALAGKSSGGGTTNVKFRDQADSKDRIDATVDSSGNRSAVTVDGG